MPMTGNKKIRPKSFQSNLLGIYSALVTILLIFFICIASVSSIEPAKYNKLAAAFSQELIIEEKPQIESFKAKTDEIINFTEKTKSFLKENHMTSDINIGYTDDFIILRIDNNTFFKSDGWKLDEKNLMILDFVSQEINKLQNDVFVCVNVHFFDDENTGKTDLREHSATVANEIVAYLEKKSSISAEKFVAIGWGNTLPIPDNDNSNEKLRLKNSRVEIVLSTKNYSKDSLKSFYKIIKQDN